MRYGFSYIRIYSPQKVIELMYNRYVYTIYAEMSTQKKKRETKPKTLTLQRAGPAHATQDWKKILRF